jgi:hypothetical protein
VLGGECDAAVTDSRISWPLSFPAEASGFGNLCPPCVISGRSVGSWEAFGFSGLIFASPFAFWSSERKRAPRDSAPETTRGVRGGLSKLANCSRRIEPRPADELAGDFVMDRKRSVWFPS